MPRAIPRLVLGGLSSGAGKTTVTSALARAFRDRGLRVAVFKCGPDYLDPTYHRRAAGTASHNLDGWMMGHEGVLSTFTRVAANADIALIEGVMGLFDGADPKREDASTAQIAKWLDAPVLAVIDASGMARTLGAIAHGLAGYDPTLNLAGLVCNHVGSRGHLTLLHATEPLALPIFGGLPKSDATVFPERHLGLRTAQKDAIAEDVFAALGQLAAEWLPLDRILDLARSAPALAGDTDAIGNGTPSRVKCRIGIADDDAFHFYYEDNLARLRAAGAELVPFSPIRDRALPSVDGLYLGGGYPEVHAEALAGNELMRASIRDFAARRRPIYAECGGLMYLTQSLRVDGATFPMVGLLPATVTMHERLQALGYVEVETAAPSLLGGAGTRFRGHQFRYSSIEADAGLSHAYRVHRRRDRSAFTEGFQQDATLGSYVHAHWASNASIARSFVDRCSVAA